MRVAVRDVDPRQCERFEFVFFGDAAKHGPLFIPGVVRHASARASDGDATAIGAGASQPHGPLCVYVYRWTYRLMVVELTVRFGANDERSVVGEQDVRFAIRRLRMRVVCDAASRANLWRLNIPRERVLQKLGDAAGVMPVG